MEQSCKIYLTEYKNCRKRILGSLLQIEDESSSYFSEGIYLNILTDLIGRLTEVTIPENTDLSVFDISTIFGHDFVGEFYDIKNRLDSLRKAIGELKCEIDVEKLFDMTQ